MSAVSLPLDRSQRVSYDWTSEEGLDKLKKLVAPSLKYEPRKFQLYDAACILNGRDVFCITATGDGKSALIYIPPLAQRDIIVMVIQPTNFLENDLVSSLVAKGLHATVINAESLVEATKAGRDLWREARECRWQILTFSPETIRTAEFDKLIQNHRFRAQWRVLVTDEAHIVDEWGADFRTAYSDIWSLRSRGPAHLVFVALSASVEPGRQTTNILHSLGFRKDHYLFDRRDCERHNVDFIFRTMEYPSTGHEFRDLDWLIPETMTKASDVDKVVLYCDTIELGHRVAHYLRSLLPPMLKSLGHILIRHMHSINCPECKHEGFAALYEAGDERQSAIFVATAVLEVGVNIPGLHRVISYGGSKSASSWIQEGGRPAREPNSTGEAIFYVKKSDIDAALTYVQSEPVDERLLTKHDSKTHDTASIVEGGSMEGRSEGAGREEGDTVSTSDDLAMAGPSEDRDDDGEGLNDDTTTVRTTTSLVTAAKTKCPSKQLPVTKTMANSRKSVPGPGRRICTARLLIIAAHARGYCITRQINIIYGNPGVSRDCGRCSSCLPRPIPRPRALLGEQDEEEASVNSPEAPADPDAPKVPAYMKLNTKDIIYVAKRLCAAARELRRSGPSKLDRLFIGPQCFLDETYVKKITRDFHLMDSKSVLASRMSGWRYWEDSGAALWDVVKNIADEVHELLTLRHEETLAKQRANRQKKREEEVRAELVAVGLDTVKRVTLKVQIASAHSMVAPDTVESGTPRRPAPQPPRHTGLLAPVPSAQFYNISAGAYALGKRRASTSENMDAPEKKRPRTASKATSASKSTTATTCEKENSAPSLATSLRRSTRLSVTHP